MLKIKSLPKCVIFLCGIIGLFLTDFTENKLTNSVIIFRLI